MTIFTPFVFSLFWLQILNFAGFAPKQKYTDWTVCMETVGPYCKILSEKETIRAQGFA